MASRHLITRSRDNVRAHLVPKRRRFRFRNNDNDVSIVLGDDVGITNPKRIKLDENETTIENLVCSGMTVENGVSLSEIKVDSIDVSGPVSVDSLQVSGTSSLLGAATSTALSCSSLNCLGAATTGALSSSSVSSSGSVSGASLNISGASTFGALSSSSFSSSGLISGGSLDISGPATAASLTSTGAVSGASLNISGASTFAALSSSSFSSSGLISGGSLNIVGSATTGALAPSSVSSSGIIFAGSALTTAGAIGGASLNISGGATAGSLTSTGSVSGASLNISGASTFGALSSSSFSSAGLISGGSLNISGASTFGALSSSSFSSAGSISGGSLNISGAATTGALSSTSVTSSSSLQGSSYCSAPFLEADVVTANGLASIDYVDAGTGSLRGGSISAGSYGPSTSAVLTSASGPISLLFNTVLGFRFQVAVESSITSFGYKGPGLINAAATRDAGIWRELDGKLLYQGTVSKASPLDAFGYRMTPLGGTLKIVPGVPYIFGVLLLVGDDGFNSTASFDTNVISVVGKSLVSPTLSMPTGTGGANVNTGASIAFLPYNVAFSATSGGAVTAASVTTTSLDVLGNANFGAVSAISGDRSSFSFFDGGFYNGVGVQASSYIDAGSNSISGGSIVINSLQAVTSAVTALTTTSTSIVTAAVHGFSFSVLSTAELDFWGFAPGGLLNAAVSRDIGIWRSDGKLLMQGTVAVVGGLDPQGYRTSATPATLQLYPGIQYTVGLLLLPGDNVYSDTPSVSNLALITKKSIVSPMLVMPTVSGAANVTSGVQIRYKPYAEAFNVSAGAGLITTSLPYSCGSQSIDCGPLGATKVTVGAGNPGVVIDPFNVTPGVPVLEVIASGAGKKASIPAPVMSLADWTLVAPKANGHQAFVTGLSGNAANRLSVYDGYTKYLAYTSDFGTWFGDGSDGAVVLNSPTTLTRDMYYDSLIVTTGAVVDTNSFRIYVRGLLTMNGTGVIRQNGASASLATGGAAMTLNTVGGNFAGGAGGLTSQGSGGAGINAALSLGGLGGKGGDPASGSGLGGSVVDSRAVSTSRQANNFLSAMLAMGSAGGVGGPFRGGGGGSGGAATATVNGGGGGAGGGIIWIAASEVSVGGFGTLLEAKGGAGGDAAGAGGGVGGGGGGGAVILICSTSQQSSTTIKTFMSVSPGANGTIGNTLNAAVATAGSKICIVMNE